MAICHLNHAPLRARVGGAGVIALVRGEVAIRRPDHVVVDCGGVGYRLAVSAQTLRHVPPVGKQVTLHAHLIPRDDALNLFGFASEDERDLFLALIGVQSVGPKVALAVLSGGSPRELISRHRHRRRRPLPGRPRHRQAHGRADHRRAAREGRRAASRRRRPIVRHAAPRTRATLAREGLLGLGYEPPEVDALLPTWRARAPRSSSPRALRGARR